MFKPGKVLIDQIRYFDKEEGVLPWERIAAEIGAICMFYHVEILMTDEIERDAIRLHFFGYMLDNLLRLAPRTTNLLVLFVPIRPILREQ